MRSLEDTMNGVRLRLGLTLWELVKKYADYVPVWHLWMLGELQVSAQLNLRV
jgi:hypothetical protein